MMDFRYAFRTLRKSPGFAITAILTLALGIGSSAAIFTLLDQVSLRPLPIKEPGRFVLLRWEGIWNGSNTGYASWSYPWYEDLAEQTGEIFEELIGRATMPMAVGVGGEAEQADVVLVTGNYFRTLGVGAAAGRVFQDSDNENVDAHPVAVLSYEYWRDRFGASRSAIGQTILLNQHPFEIVGVSQKGFRGIDFGTRPKVFIPAKMKDTVSVGFQRDIYPIDNRRGRWINVFGRLREDVSREQAEAAIAPIMQAGIEYDLTQPELAGMDERGRDRYREARILIEPGGQGRRHDRSRLDSPLMLLMAMVGLLLLIACGNVANLLMARAAGRTKEVAVRFAIGASRARVVRQLLAECGLIATAAAALGLLAANWAAGFILRLAPEGAESVNFTTEPDWRIVAFATGAAAVTTFLFGLLPALRTTQVHLAPALKDQAGSIAGGNDGWRRTLAGSQIFFSLLLLIGAGLFTRSLMELRNIDPGIETEHTIVFAIDPMQGGYDDEATRHWLARLEQGLAARPEVVSAGFSTMRMLDGDTWNNSVTVEGYEQGPEEPMVPNFNAVSPGYFRTLEIPFLEGRDFTEADEQGGPPVGVVNKAFVDHYFPGESPIGRHFSFYIGPEIEIVGVVPDTRYEGVREDIPEQVFVPFVQSPWPTGAHVYVRTGRRPEEAVPASRAVARELDATLPVVALRTMQDQKNSTLTNERLLAFLATAFGVLATILAAVGLYGLLAYSVARRKREIGLRIALGAQRGDVSWLVLKEVVWLFGIGAAAAVPAALLLGRWTESQLYGVRPTDPLTMGVAIVGLGLVALAAGYLPARRAARTEPMQALRLE